MEMLKSLKEHGKKMAVVSNKYCKATEHLCRTFFNGYIDVAIGENENIRKKPAPDTVLEAMKRLGADKGSTVYVGDSEVDIATAHNCGIPCISVLWGFRDKTFLTENGGTMFAKSPEEIFSRVSSAQGIIFPSKTKSFRKMRPAWHSCCAELTFSQASVWRSMYSCTCSL